MSIAIQCCALPTSKTEKSCQHFKMIISKILSPYVNLWSVNSWQQTIETFWRYWPGKILRSMYDIWYMYLHLVHFYGKCMWIDSYGLWRLFQYFALLYYFSRTGGVPSSKLTEQWNIPMFNRKYIFNPGPFSIAMLVYQSVYLYL